MSSLIAGTNAIGMDEACWSISEFNQATPDSKGVHRYQIIKIMRGGPPIVEFRRDLGDSRTFACDEFCIPGGVCDPETGRYWIEHTVGELYDMAERMRTRYNFAPPEPPKPSDLVGLYYDQPDKDKRAAKALSQFGSAARIQRT